MNDLMFDHTKQSMIESLGVKVIDLRKFLIDIEHADCKTMSQRVEFVWSADISFEMKIAVTFVLGGFHAVKGPLIVQGSLKDLPPSLLKKLKDDGLIS